MKSQDEVNSAIEKYADTVRRICYMHLKNYNDVEDIFQEVFIKYLMHNKPFEDAEHEKAWIIRVTINRCKDFFKSFYRKKVTTIDDITYIPDMEKRSFELLDAILRLPKKYKDVIYLHYYEGYSAIEIGKILHKNENTIYTWLSRGRQELKKSLGGEE